MRAFADTNVLFPFSVMDLLLALTEDQVHELVWSDFLLDEWQRVIVREGKRTSESASTVADAIRKYFGDMRIALEDYAHLVDGAPSPDPDDRHHIAAAIVGADVIVTWNLGDFPAEEIAAYAGRRLPVLTPDEYLCELFDSARDEVLATVRRLAGEKRRPPMSPADLVDRIGGAQAKRFAARIGAVLAA